MTVFEFIFVCFVCIFVVLQRSRAEKSCQQLSVVIFFTESDKIPSSATGMKFLEMSEMARLKHNTLQSNDIHPYIAQRNIPNCEELLKDGLDSLTHFCQNALGMKTAIVSVSSQAITNEIKSCKSQTSSQRRETRQKYNRNYHETPIKKQLSSVSRIKRARMREIITSPEHKEVFNIRVKRDKLNPADGRVGEIPDFSLNGGRTKPPWDVLDVMSHVRFSFFGNLFDAEKKKKLSMEENGLLSNLIGQKKEDPGLFETVKSTLATLQETPGEAFLMVVFGGHLHEICDKHSPLVQSLKHVTEVTDIASTLIVTTGACPCDCKKENDEVVIIKEDARDSHPGQNILSLVPVYARGPKSEKLTQCTVLYDIPLTIKNILEEYSPTFGDALKEQMRHRRSSSYGIPQEFRHSRNEGNRRYYAMHRILLHIVLLVNFIY